MQGQTRFPHHVRHRELIVWLQVQLVVVGIVGRSSSSKAHLLRQLSGQQTVTVPQLGLHAYLDREQRRVYLLCSSVADFGPLAASCFREGARLPTSPRRSPTAPPTALPLLAAGRVLLAH